MTKKAKNAPILLLFHGEKLRQDYVLKYGRIQCVPKLHYVLQSTMGRYDFLLWPEGFKLHAYTTAFQLFSVIVSVKSKNNHVSFMNCNVF